MISLGGAFHQLLYKERRESYNSETRLSTKSSTSFDNANTLMMGPSEFPSAGLLFKHVSRFLGIESYLNIIIAMSDR
jgi:hypothetical protein